MYKVVFIDTNHRLFFHYTVNSLSEITNARLLQVLYTDRKENQIFLIYKEIQSGAVAKSYMRYGFLIYDDMRKYFPISHWGGRKSYMTLQLLHSEFPWEKFDFISVVFRWLQVRWCMILHMQREGKRNVAFGGLTHALFAGEGRVRKMMKVAVTPLDEKSRLSRWGVQQLVLATEAGFILIIEKGGGGSGPATLLSVGLTVCATKF